MEKLLEFFKNNFDNDCQKAGENLFEQLKSVDLDQKMLSRGCDIASVLTPLKLDFETYVACVLLPFIENESLKKEDISSFDESIVNAYELAVMSIKISNFDYTSGQAEMENIRSMLLAIGKDIRVMIVRLAEVVILARNTKSLEKKQAEELHFEIKEIYSPIASRLGLSYIKSELNDLNLSFYKPVMYKKILKQVAEITRNGMDRIDKVVSSIKQILDRLEIKGECYGRVKHVSSIYNKLQEKNKVINQIYDMCAIRVIVPTKNDCYTILAEIHTQFVSMDSRFKDYIARPKANGYQSLHTVILIDDEPLEVQIRTYEMHNHAEYGVAAHFLYKEHKNKLDSFDGKLLWIRKLLENQENTSASELIEGLKTDVYSGEIFVQSPMGKVIQLTEGSTPIDFAYAIHSAVGNKCVGSRVNGKMVPLSYVLSNGDVVEIITSQNAKGPSRDWLKIAKTANTRNKINQFFRHEMKEENIKKGKSILDLAAKTKGYNLKELLDDKWLAEALEKYAFHNEDEMFAAVGYGSVTSTQILNKLIDLYLKNNPAKTQTILNNIEKSSTKKQDIDGIAGIMVKYAKCCNPVPGDEILGFVSRGNGVTVHRADCVALKAMEQDRIMPMEWGEKASENKNYVASLRLYVDNATGVLAQISNKIAENKINITKIISKNHSLEEAIIDIDFYVNNKQQLDDFINKLEAMSIVHSVVRGGK